MTDDSPAIGIDLGTTTCCVGYLAGNKHDVDIIENQHGDRTTPSYVAFTDDKEVIGKSAKEKVYRTPGNVIYDSKRLIGRLYTDEYIKRNLTHWTFAIIPSEDNKPLIQISKNDKPVTYKPHKISAKLLSHMKKIAEQRTGKKITNAVITVPAYFNYHQRIATRKAGKLAKLHVLKIMNEPTAAVLAYVHKNEIDDCENILVFDLGGGTFDVSVVGVQQKNITVKATSGNTFLGGRDFDNNLSTFITDKLKETYKIDVTKVQTAVRRINARCEKIKTELSFEPKTTLDLHNVLSDGQDVDLKVARADFEKINAHLFELCLKTVANCLDQANVDKEDVKKVLLVGGSTRIPKLREMLAEFFGCDDKLTQGINPDEAVAYGAAIQAATFKKDKIDLHKINEVTPLSLGVDVMGHMMSVVIARNTPIPVTETKTYITVSDKQRQMAINVYEGERPLVKHNTKIGTCVVDLPPQAPGYPVEVTFHIDANGILHVGTTTDSGLYAQLYIEYEKRVEQKTDDALRDAIENKERDEKVNAVISRWVRLKEYCINMKSLRTYKSEAFNEEEKSLLEKATDATFKWVSNHKVENGNEEELNDILAKQKEIQTICEPILKKYGFDIMDMCISDFYNLVN